MNLKYISYVLFLLVMSFVFQVNAQEKFKTYHNGKFAYSIDYPANFKPQGESDSGDGQRFISPDGRAKLTVYAGYNVFEETMKQLYKEAIKYAKLNKVTYSVVKPNFFVVSGFKLNNDCHCTQIFYQRTVERDGLIITFMMEYDEKLKSTYDPIVVTIGKSF